MNPTTSTAQPQSYKLLFELAPDAMLTIDREGRILEINAEAEKMFGYSREELIGERVEELIPERFREGHQVFRAGYQASPTYRPMKRGRQLHALRKNGTEFPVDISLCPIEINEGLTFFAVVRDTCEALQALQTAKHLKLEESLSGLSARFINLPANQVDLEITNGLQVLVEAVEADRVTLAQLDPETEGFIVTHEYIRPGIPRFEGHIIKGALPWLAERAMKGETTRVEKPQDLPPEAANDRKYMESIGIKSSLVVPFRVSGTVTGGMGVDSFLYHKQWDAKMVSRVQDVADIFANALSRKRSDVELQKAAREVRQLKEQLERENLSLREEIKLEHAHGEVVGNSAGIRAVLKKAEKVAPTDSAVLILGETGTGKELIARTIHELSSRKIHPMVKINCAALPSTLIESELFGREKGAYTGALAREIGRFELADKSTIFLDEIGELPPEVQSKLLRVLQEGEFERLGSPKTMHVDVRVIAATSRDLKTMVKEGKFREDLFYRLNVFPIVLPPLRERRDDIPALVWHILTDLGKRMGRNIEAVHASTMHDLQNYSWPGNVRELRNVIERNLILHTGTVFRAELPEPEPGDSRDGLRRLTEVESDHFRNVLQSTGWRVRGKGGAAEILGLKPTTLEAKMKKLGIQRPR